VASVKCQCQCQQQKQHLFHVRDRPKQQKKKLQKEKRQIKLVGGKWGWSPYTQPNRNNLLKYFENKSLPQKTENYPTKLHFRNKLFNPLIPLLSKLVDKDLNVNLSGI